MAWKKAGSKKEAAWGINQAAADLAQGQRRCTRLRVQNARKSAKSLLNPEKTVRYTVRIVIQSARTKAVHNNSEIPGTHYLSISSFLIKYCVLVIQIRSGDRAG